MLQLYAVLLLSLKTENIALKAIICKAAQQG
jgi:hypothetical protein